MMTAIVEDILRRIDSRAPTGFEIRLRQASLRDVERLLSEIAEPAGRRPGSRRMRARRAA